MLNAATSYDAMRQNFAWDLPAQLNMADQVLAHPLDQVAIINGEEQITYGQLSQMVDSLVHELITQGADRKTPIGVLLGQDPWCAAAHIAIWKIGSISMPLFKLFQQDALQSRLADSGAQLVITDAKGAELLKGLSVTPILPKQTKAAAMTSLKTSPDDPAVLIYTSGTTGAPKGALHGHRVLTGHLPGVEISHNLLGQPGDCLWTPADWAWIGGLFDVLMPGLALGLPVVASRMRKFDPAACVDLIARHNIRNVFFPPTALRMLKAAGQLIPGLRSVASGGEPLGAEMLEWGRHAFGLTINEFYGQTECNMVASSCADLFAPQPGAIGRAVPGHQLAVLDADGETTEDEGDIAVKRGSASMMLGYWNRAEATAEKYRGDWMLTGDRGRWQGDYLQFVGREDDVITSAGYRIGPAEIEDCLLTHPAVATVGVVGKPDPLRTQIVKAYVVRKDQVRCSEDELKTWVKSRLSAHAYPREVTFLDSLPMTVTGKVIRKELKARAAQELQ